MKEKIIDKVSDILSYPARRQAQKSIAKSNAELADSKLVRETKDVDIGDADYKNPVFRARANVAVKKMEQQRRVLKLKK